MKKNNYNQPGFSLIEVLAVLFIVTVSLIGLVSLIIQNIQAQTINKNNLIAYNLAQEGVELIRQVRDSNWKKNLAYDTNLADGTYYMDYLMEKPLTVLGDSGKIYLHDGFYINLKGTESGAVPTIFTREIFLNKPTFEGYNPLQVRVLVSWEDRNRPYRHELRTLLFNWK